MRLVGFVVASGSASICFTLHLQSRSLEAIYPGENRLGSRISKPYPSILYQILDSFPSPTPTALFTLSIDSAWARRMAVPYTPYYCEENIYAFLAAQAATTPTSSLAGPRAYALFITNDNKTALLRYQKTGDAEEERNYVIWDYHVVAVVVRPDILGNGVEPSSVVNTKNRAKLDENETWTVVDPNSELGDFVPLSRGCFPCSLPWSETDKRPYPDYLEHSFPSAALELPRDLER